MTEQVLNLESLAALIDEKQPKCICGQTLKGSGLRYYTPHPGGYWVEGVPEKAWVYVHCPHCGYDVALHKIWRELQ